MPLPSDVHGFSTPAYAYSLFQETQFNPEGFIDVDIKDILVRLLQTAGNISMSRITAFLEFPWNLSAQAFAKTTQQSFVKIVANTLETCSVGKTARLNTYRNWKERLVFYIAAEDMKALYPSLCRDTVNKALGCSLEVHSIFNTRASEIIVELNRICLNNVVLQPLGWRCHQTWRLIKYPKRWESLGLIGKLYCALQHYILQPTANVLTEAELFRRFTDDIIWITASKTSNEGIRQELTSAFAHSGLGLTLRQT